MVVTRMPRSEHVCDFCGQSGHESADCRRLEMFRHAPALRSAPGPPLDTCTSSDGVDEGSAHSTSPVTRKSQRLSTREALKPHGTSSAANGNFTPLDRLQPDAIFFEFICSAVENLRRKHTRSFHWGPRLAKLFTACAKQRCGRRCLEVLRCPFTVKEGSGGKHPRARR